MTPEQLEQLRDYVAEHLQPLADAADDVAIAAALNARTDGEVVTFAGVIAALSNETAARLATNPNLETVRQMFLSGDWLGIGLWLGLFVKAGIVTPEEYQALQAAIASAPRSIAESFGIADPITAEQAGGLR